MRPLPGAPRDASGVEQYLAWGQEMARRGDHRSALAAFHRGLALQPPQGGCRTTTGHLLRGIGESAFVCRRFDLVVRAMGDVITRCGELRDPRVHLLLGQARFELGDREAAVDDLMRARVLSPGDAVFVGEDPKYLALLEGEAAAG